VFNFKIKFGTLVTNILPDSWKNFRVTLTNSASNGIVTMSFVKTIILNEEVNQQTQQVSSSQI